MSMLLYIRCTLLLLPIRTFTVSFHLLKESVCCYKLFTKIVGKLYEAGTMQEEQERKPLRSANDEKEKTR